MYAHYTALARDQGWRQPKLVAEMCGIQPGNVERLAKSCPPQWLEAAALCLGDERLVVDPRDLHPDFVRMATAGRR